MGNQFVVNVKAGIDYIKVDRLDQTVDYEVMLQIIKSEFAKPTPLLEELAHRIEQAILIKYPAMRYFFLSIQKRNPPLGSEVYSSEVSVERRY